MLAKKFQDPANIIHQVHLLAANQLLFMMKKVKETTRMNVKPKEIVVKKNWLNVKVLRVVNATIFIYQILKSVIIIIVNALRYLKAVKHMKVMIE